MVSHSLPATQTLSLPESDPIIHGLLIVAFLIHALFMNLVLGGILITVMTDAIGIVTGRVAYRQLAVTLANWLPGFLGMAVVVGVLPLVLVQILYGSVFATPAGLLGEVWTIAVVALVLGAGGVYGFQHWRESLAHRPGLRLALGMLSGIMFLSVAFVFVIVSVLMLHPDQWADIKQVGIWSVLNLPSLVPRFGHLVLAAVAGMGMFLVGYGLYFVSEGQALADHELRERYATWVTRYGVAWTLAGTLPQIVVGPWLFLSLPEVVQFDLMSGQSFGSLAFFVGLTAALLSVVLLNAALMAPHIRGLAIGGTLSIVVTVCLMVVVRHAVRVVWLGQHDHAALLTTNDQWTVMFIVSAMVLLGMAVIVFLLKRHGKTFGVLDSSLEK